jgi:hypothetical protein
MISNIIEIIKILEKEGFDKKEAILIIIADELKKINYKNGRN